MTLTRFKSVNNPDLHVELVKGYAIKNFLSHSLLDCVLVVEKAITAKKDMVGYFYSVVCCCSGLM
jgi:hypothetical protein